MPLSRNGGAKLRHFLFAAKLLWHKIKLLPTDLG